MTMTTMLGVTASPAATLTSLPAPFSMAPMLNVK